MLLTVTLNPSIDKLYRIDAEAPYTVMRVRQVVNTAGGKGMNVSRVAVQLGEPVTAMGFVGGHVGEYFESLITEAGIRKAFTHVSGETRSCINAWDDSRGLSTEYLEPGVPVTAADVARFEQAYMSELISADAVSISGSMPQGVPADFYARLIALAREAGKRVYLDTSGETLRRSVRALPTFIKPNTDEIEQLLGRAPADRAELISAARALHDGGIAEVAVSLGAEGALYVTDEGVLTGCPPRITPRNTVGCGDSMVAGFAVGASRGLDADERLRLAIAVSAANALSMSTGGFEPQDLETLAPQVRIDRIG